MKIALLAPSGAGKTVYLTGLYGVLTQELSNGPYGIDFKVPDTRKNSYLDERYTRLLEDHDFGEGTDKKCVYPLTLSTPDENGGTRRLPVSIVDFPGGFLHRASDENQAAVEQTIEELSQCDGFIVLLDGEGLIKGVQSRDPRILQNRTRASAVQSVLKSALEHRRARLAQEKADPNAYAFDRGPTPVVFALTKDDKVQDWLAGNPEQAGEKLDRTVRKLFTLSADASRSYEEREGALANFMRSQFGPIIDAPDVVSMRTTVCVYNESEEIIDPRNVEHLFQFVLFTGLCNAAFEYHRRLKDWEKDQRNNKAKLQSETSAYNRAQEGYAEWQRRPLWQDFVRWLNDEEGYTAVSDRLTSYRADMERAAAALNASTLSVKQATDNMETALLFQRRILSDRLAYLLTYGNGKNGFYQKGLQVEELLRMPWWKEKCRAGKDIIEREAQNERELAL